MNEPIGGKSPSSWALLRPYLLDVGVPFIAYLAVAALGAAAVWALTAAGLAAALSAGFNTVRQRGLDSAGCLVLLEIGVSIAVLVFVRDPRLMLVRPSFYTGAAAVYLAYTALFATPVSYPGSRVMAAAGGPARIAAYERAWAESREFRTTHRIVTLGIGIALAADSVLRAVIVFHYPLERSAWLSNVPHVAAVAVAIGVSAFAGRRFARIVDGYVALGGK